MPELTPSPLEPQHLYTVSPNNLWRPCHSPAVKPQRRHPLGRTVHRFHGSAAHSVRADTPQKLVFVHTQDQSDPHPFSSCGLRKAHERAETGTWEKAAQKCLPQLHSVIGPRAAWSEMGWNLKKHITH